MFRVEKLIVLLVVGLLSVVNCQLSMSQTLVYLERADNLLFDQQKLPDARIVVGNVLFRHDEALMYCDSANFY